MQSYYMSLFVKLGIKVTGRLGYCYGCMGGGGDPQQLSLSSHRAVLRNGRSACTSTSQDLCRRQQTALSTV